MHQNALDTLSFRFLPRLAFALILGFTVAFFAGQSSAHTRWDPDGLIKPRTNNDNIKLGPCGAARTENAVVLQSGATIEVAFESTIYHQGHFRIAFSEADDQGFDAHVLADQIPDFPDQRYRTESITLPDIECSACTLQLIQTMPDRNPPTDYFSCADIQLTATGTPPDDSNSPPQPVTGATALPGDRSANLNWMNPTDESFFRVLILQTSSGTTPIPEAGQQYQRGETADGAQVVYVGSEEFARVGELLPGRTYDFHLFTYSAALLYSDAVEATVDIPEIVDNLAPTVSLAAEQAQSSGSVVHPNDGPVVVQALVTDANPNDRHTFDWSATDARLVNTSPNPQQFIFDPTALNIGTYAVTLTVNDNGTPSLSDTVTMEIRVEQPEARSGGLHLWLLVSLALFAIIRQQRT